MNTKTMKQKGGMHSLLLAFCIVFIALLAFPAAVSADGWVGGVPLTTVQTGTVTGDLYIDANPAPNWGDKDVTKTFVLPANAVGNITWARLYVSAYAGHMQDDKAFTMTNKFDGNGDGTYEQVWPETGHEAFQYVLDPLTYESVGNDNSEFTGHGTHEPYLMINDHETRVTSDYFAYYDVTNMISNQTVFTNVNTAGSEDGRIKVITLVVSYNDPSSTTQTTYWVNQGHDVCSYYTEDNFGTAAVGTTTFGTTGLSGITSATLTADYMASNNGNYGFPTAVNNFAVVGGTPPVTGDFTSLPLDRVADEQGDYSGVDSWDVTSSVTGASDVTFAYSRYFPGTGTAAFYKIPLAILVVKKPAPATAPVAQFASDTRTGTAPLNITFTDQSSNDPTSWAWTFGDSGTSTEQNPIHQYTAAGNYTVTLTATNAGGSGTETKTDYITISAPAVAPVADFSGTPTSGTAPLTVTFTDASANAPTSWAWDFGDGDSTNATMQNPVHTYTAAGTYTVNLTVTNAAGSDDETKTDYITVTGAVPVADFTATPLTGARPLIVSFTDQSSNTPTSWAWNFGDGNTTDNTLQNPVHLYTAAGIYTVTLTATNGAGSDDETRTGYITVTPQCDLTISGTVIMNPASSVFANLPNSVKINTIKNNGPDTITNIPVALYASDVSSTVPVSTFTIASLASAGTNSTYATDPTIRPSSTLGQTVTYTAVVDPDNLIAETNEANNNKAGAATTIKYNGYTSKRYTSGSDINSAATYDGKYGLVYSWGDSTAASTVGTRTSTYSSTDLPVPSGATIVSARLYQAYRYGGHAPTWTMTFNGNDITGTQTGYNDSVFYGTTYLEGLYVYDVTSSFNTAGNTVVETLPDTGLAVSGAYLVVVYSDPSTTEKKIWINEEFDHLKSFTSSGVTTVSSNQATAWANFAGADTSRLASAKAIAICPFLQSGTSATFFFGSTQYPALLSSGAQSVPNIAVKEYNVTSALSSGANTARIQSTLSGTSGADMYAANAILVVEKTAAAPVAAFSGTPTSGTTPLTVVFTDASTNAPTSWEWDFGDSDSTNATEQNPVHTYAAAGTYTVTLIATNAAGSDSETQTSYITVSNGVIALPGQSLLPTDPDHDSLYEDLNGNGVKDTADVVLFFKNRNWMSANEPIALFDFNQNSALDTADVILLFKKHIP